MKEETTLVTFGAFWTLALFIGVCLYVEKSKDIIGLIIICVCAFYALIGVIYVLWDFKRKKRLKQ